jgi:Ca2+-transporting ATPase
MIDPQIPQSLEAQPSRQWHTLSAAEVLAHFGTTADGGLSEAEARQRLSRYGPNRLREKESEPLWEMILEELREPIVLLLLATGALYALWGEVTDALTIFFVILTLAGIEVFNENRAERAIEALREMAEPTALARRGGQSLELESEKIVPGDCILLNAGRSVPADARLLESYGLAVDESALSGESVPVEKEALLTLPQDTALAERRNLVFAGTTVTRGRASAVVVATGTSSQLGRVAELAEEVESPRTPLQQAMRELSGSLVWLALAFSLAVPILGWLLTDQSLQELILTGLSLAFATIPEEMPIIVTMVLALGAYRLSRQQAIVKELKAVETLGAVTVIATDKTGTLTQNRMQVSELYPDRESEKLLETALLCSAGKEGGAAVQDPLEAALVDAAQKAGLELEPLHEGLALRDEFTFDSRRKMMSVVYEMDSGLWVAAKGAPEAVLAHSSRLWTGVDAKPLTGAAQQAILSQAAQMADKGLRVIACAEKTVADGRLRQEEAETDLTFVGLVGFADPARPEAREAIDTCKRAGIRPKMITGDHPLTAQAIARQVGLDADGQVMTGAGLDALSDEALRERVGYVSIFARTTPEHKLRIVQALRQRGERVAVTGDGINDAPALVAADIGVAMGERGSDVAREAGDIVLTDDNFATIVHAIHQGRVVFANLKKGTRYYLTCKVALVSATLLATLLGLPVPFAPVQIILMEMFMDLAAAATFVAEPAEAGLMQQPPRDPRRRFMDREMVQSIFTSAVGLFAAVSAVYLSTWYHGAGLVRAQTAAFVTWLLAHVLLAWNMRSEREPVLKLGLGSNRLMVTWGATTVLFVLVATWVPWLNTALKTVPLSSREWALILIAAAAGTLWMEARKWWQTGQCL